MAVTREGPAVGVVRSRGVRVTSVLMWVAALSAALSAISALAALGAASQDTVVVEA